MMEAVSTLVEETKLIFEKVNLAIIAIMVNREELRQRGLEQHIPKPTVEGGRCLRSCSPGLPWATKAAFLTVFSIQMMDSSHKENFRDMILSRPAGWWLNTSIPKQAPARH